MTLTDETNEDWDRLRQLIDDCGAVVLNKRGLNYHVHAGSIGRDIYGVKEDFSLERAIRDLHQETAHRRTVERGIREAESRVDLLEHDLKAAKAKLMGARRAAKQEAGEQ